MEAITIKRGDTLTIGGVYDEDGVPTSLAGIEIASQVRDSRGDLVATLTATPDPDQVTNPGVFTLVPPANPIDWAIDEHVCDVQFTNAGNVRSFPTFRIIVEPDVTHA